MQPRLSFGLAVAGLGVAMGALMARHPEGLRVPMWVGLAAVGVFVAAGAAIVAQAAGAPRLNRIALLCLLLALSAPPAWIAFGQGPRACAGGVGVGGLTMTAWPAPDLQCRFAFGLGAVLLALMLAIFLVKWARGTQQ